MLGDGVGAGVDEGVGVDEVGLGVGLGEDDVDDGFGEGLCDTLGGLG